MGMLGVTLGFTGNACALGKGQGKHVFRMVHGSGCGLGSACALPTSMVAQSMVAARAALIMAANSYGN
jgi:hydroxyethylthiazole kinase-like sugar kinase family protein